jgi:hypothetical protein
MRIVLWCLVLLAIFFVLCAAWLSHGSAGDVPHSSPSGFTKEMSHVPTPLAGVDSSFVNGGIVGDRYGRKVTRPAPLSGVSGLCGWV